MTTSITSSLDAVNELLLQAAEQDMDLHTAADMPAAERHAPRRRPQRTMTATAPDARDTASASGAHRPRGADSMTDLRVSIGDTNGDGRRHVVYRLGEAEYPDVIDLASGYQREQSMRRALEALGLPADNLPGLAAEVVRLAKEKDQKAESQLVEFRRITCRELDAATYDQEYLIDGALVAGQPCILAGGKKNLKTSILIDLAISLAVGGHFLGRMKVNRAARVGVMSGESGLATIQETARRIARAAGRRLADIGGLVWSDHLPQFGNVAHEEALRRFLTGDEIEVLAVDPAYLCLPDIDHANLFDVGQRLRGISEICQEAGALLLLCHHTRKTKADPFSPPELEDIAWAGFQEYCRQWLLVGRREIYEPGTGVHRLWLSAGGSAGHSDLWAVDISEGTRATPGGRYWDVEVMRPDDARQAVADRQEQLKAAKAQEQDQRDKAKIVRAMASLEREHPEGNSATAIRDRSYLKGQRFTSALEALVDDGHAVPCEIIRSNRKTPMTGYRLNKQGAET